jgi:hypothetical protein
MPGPKPLLLRALGDLSRSRTLYRQLVLDLNEPALCERLRQMERRVAEDYAWVQSILREQHGVNIGA